MRAVTFDILKPPSSAFQAGISTFGDLDCTWTTETAGRCTAQQAWLVVVGCEHEHILDVLLCDEHRQQLSEHYAAQGKTWCNPCGTLPEADSPLGGGPHQCAAVIVRVEQRPWTPT